MTACLGMARAHDVLEAVLASTWKGRAGSLCLRPDACAPRCNEHAAIAAAIDAGDPSAAREAMRRHLDTTSALLESLAQKQPGLFSLVRNPS